MKQTGSAAVVCHLCCDAPICDLHLPTNVQILFFINIYYRRHVLVVHMLLSVSYNSWYI